MAGHYSRRTIMASAASLAGAAVLPEAARGVLDPGAGAIAHILPTVSHDRMRLKLSLRAPAAAPPVLKVDGRPLAGLPGGTRGRHWRFDARGLDPARRYTLSLSDAGGRPLTDDWHLSTFPAPEAEPERPRLLVFTCAGGMDDMTDYFLPIATRRRLLARALSFAPDAVVAIGDHIYADQRRIGVLTNPEEAERNAAYWERYGQFDRSLPVLGTPNEALLTTIADIQIAALYGDLLRSLPVFFVTDDHDWFENDEASHRLITFPPDWFSLQLGRSVQHLYYPEFLPDPARPKGLPGRSNTAAEPDLSESYGTLRYGRLLETLIYDCRRFMTLKGPTGVFVDTEAEAWLLARTAAEDQTRHLIHLPSTPFGWTAGKWGEWYPDVLQPDGSMGTTVPKDYWQPGWFAQHQRLVGAIGAQRTRAPVSLSGDLHAVGATEITRSGASHFGRPVHSILTGPLGTATGAFPSAFRGTPPRVPQSLDTRPSLDFLEKNGFTLVDVTPDRIAVRLFAWRPPDPLEAIDTLEPVHAFEIPRG
ncbi:MAG: alkaline phosphatase D family protein [Alphaproteobacteria bacterium]|nr:alkaline phosphatase D family protein [Alphaproteobacteria bacterium]